MGEGAREQKGGAPKEAQAVKEPVSLHDGTGEQKGMREGTVSVFSGQTDEQVGRQTYRRARDGGHFLHKAKCPVLQARQTEFCHLGTDVDLQGP